jgi:RNA polymerase sigma-70 factor (ECF subfamily)
MEGMARTDRELLDAWRGGDAAAGSELFDRHFAELYRFFSNKVEDGIDDLIQQTFLACVESRDRFRGGSSFRTYLFTIARHELYAHWRKRRDRATVDLGEVSVQDLATSPSGVLVKHAEQKLLLRALRAIPLDLQIALELHYWEELSGPELAEVLEIPEGTVRSRLRRAREALEAKLTELADATDPGTLTSSLSGLDKWAKSLRACVVRGSVRSSD